MSTGIVYKIILLTFLSMSDVKNADDAIHDKRLLLHSDEDFVTLVHSLSSQVQSLTAALQKSKTDTDKKIQALKTQLQGQTAEMHKMATQLRQSGSTYVRWGRTTCPKNGTELAYSGYAGGAFYTQTGGGTNYLCLSKEPLWGKHTSSSSVYGKIYGVEYKIYAPYASQFFGRNIAEHDAPCAVCASSRSRVMMVPGRNECYGGWTKEYSGYLVTSSSTQPHSYEFACLDSAPESVVGSQDRKDGALFYVVEGVCGSLECPPYQDGWELTCVVCTK